MIVFVYGTTAELIKLAPIYVRLSVLGAPPALWCTMQQAEELPHAHDVLKLPSPDVELGRGVEGRSLRRTVDVVRWLAVVTATTLRRWRQLHRSCRSDGLPPCVVVHGDTMTTVLGAILGRLLGATVVHVEAGLRSFNWRHPFPEELDRRITARLANLNFAPGETEVENLRNAPGDVVCTLGNTVVDSLELVPPMTDAPGLMFETEFGLVSLHRTELLQQEVRFRTTLHALAQSAAEQAPLLMVQDPVTRNRIEELSLGSVFSPRFRAISKLDYFAFVSLLRRASFVVTDSGGLQEECAALGTPCLVHRAHTERSDGLGSNAVLSELDIDRLNHFLQDPSPFRRPPRSPAVRPPSTVVVDELRVRGFLSRRNGHA